jgi:hypothetical protein
MTQREKDIAHYKAQECGLTYSPEDFADGAEYGRKDLAQRILVSAACACGASDALSEVLRLCGIVLEGEP